MRRLGRLLTIVLVATAALTGCVAGDGGPGGSSFVASATARPQSVTRTVAFVRAPAVPTTMASPAASPAARGVAAARPATNRATGGSGAAGVTSSPQAGSPWGRYEGHLTGGSYIVAHANGGGLNVSPSPDTAPAITLSNPLPSGAPRVVVVVADAGDWLQVLLPVRPNSSVGWVRRSDVDVSTVHHRVEIDRGAHRLGVFDGDALVLDEPVAVGKASTPTPAGQFFAVELLQPSNPGGAYGSYAFTLSAYSEVYQTFGSGDGAVGVHGTNESSSIGRDASHGCVRLHNPAIERLARTLPLGTPVFIR